MSIIITVGLFGIVTSVFVGLFHGLETLSLFAIVLSFLAGACYTLMNVFYVKALQVEEASKVVPLFALGSVFITLLAAFFINEVFNLTTYLGIALVVLGAFTLSTNRIRNLDFHKGFWLMVAAAISIAVTEVSQKYLLRKYNYWTVYAYSRLFSSITILPIFFKHKQEIVLLINSKRYKVLGLMSISELLNLAAILMITIGSSMGYVTLVGALTETQHLILLLATIIISFLFPKILKEEQSWLIFRRKFLSIISLLGGVALITR